MVLASSRLPGGSWPPLLLATAIIVFIVWDPPLAHGGKSEYGKVYCCYTCRALASDSVRIVMDRIESVVDTTICTKI